MLRTGSGFFRCSSLVSEESFGLGLGLVHSTDYSTSHTFILLLTDGSWPACYSWTWNFDPRCLCTWTIVSHTHHQSSFNLAKDRAFHLTRVPPVTCSTKSIYLVPNSPEPGLCPLYPSFETTSLSCFADHVFTWDVPTVQLLLRNRYGSCLPP